MATQQQARDGFREMASSSFRQEVRYSGGETTPIASGSLLDLLGSFLAASLASGQPAGEKRDRAMDKVLKLYAYSPKFLEAIREGFKSPSNTPQDAAAALNLSLAVLKDITGITLKDAGIVPSQASGLATTQKDVPANATRVNTPRL
jgi:hypothetical protein